MSAKPVSRYELNRTKYLWLLRSAILGMALTALAVTFFSYNYTNNTQNYVYEKAHAVEVTMITESITVDKSSVATAQLPDGTSILAVFPDRDYSFPDVGESLTLWTVSDPDGQLGKHLGPQNRFTYQEVQYADEAFTTAREVNPHLLLVVIIGVGIVTALTKVMSMTYVLYTIVKDSKRVEHQMPLSFFGSFGLRKNPTPLYTREWVEWVVLYASTVIMATFIIYPYSTGGMSALGEGPLYKLFIMVLVPIIPMAGLMAAAERTYQSPFVTWAFVKMQVGRTKNLPARMLPQLSRYWSMRFHLKMHRYDKEIADVLCETFNGTLGELIKASKTV